MYLSYLHIISICTKGTKGKSFRLKSYLVLRRLRKQLLQNIKETSKPYPETHFPPTHHHHTLFISPFVPKHNTVRAVYWAHNFLSRVYGGMYHSYLHIISICTRGTKELSNGKSFRLESYLGFRRPRKQLFQNIKETFTVDPRHA